MMTHLNRRGMRHEGGYLFSAKGVMIPCRLYLSQSP